MNITGNHLHVADFITQDTDAKCTFLFFSIIFCPHSFCFPNVFIYDVDSHICRVQN